MYMLLFILWFVFAALFYFIAYKIITNEETVEKPHKKMAAIIACLIVGLLWPPFIIFAIVVWIIQRSKGKKALKDVEKKLSSL